MKSTLQMVNEVPGSEIRYFVDTIGPYFRICCSGTQMGPNGAAINEDFFFDPRKTCSNGIKVQVGSRVSRQMVQKKEIRELLDVFSGK